MDVGQDESGNKTIGITFPGSTVNMESRSSFIERNEAIAGNHDFWNQLNDKRRWWVCPLKIGIIIFCLLVALAIVGIIGKLWGSNSD